MTCFILEHKNQRLTKIMIINQNIYSLFTSLIEVWVLNIKKIFRNEKVLSKLPNILQNDEIPPVVYNHGNKFLDYKVVVNAIDVNDLKLLE